MKKIIIPIIIVTILVWTYAGITKNTIVAEQVYGSSNCGHDCYAIITRSSKEIPSTYEIVGSIGEDSRLDTSFIIVYEQKKWFSNQTRFIKLLKFQRTFTEEDYASYTSLDYNKLISESIDAIGGDHLVMTRVYEIHHKDTSTIDLLPESIITPALSNSRDVKAWIASNDPTFLNLKPLTVVDSELLSQWNQEEYIPKFEYSINSPKGLTFEQVVKIGEQKAAVLQIIDND